jgi:hypothetical protein
MFAERNGKFARASCWRIRSGPKSNSWLPKLVASSPHAFSTSIAGVSWSSAEFGGDAPTLSPAASRSVRPGRNEASSSNIVASGAAPPTVGVLRPSITIVVWSSWPWKSFSPMTDSGQTPPWSSRMSRRTTPWLCCGSGMPSRNAAVGARSMLRILRATPRSMAGPSARNVARMFVLEPRSWTSGT